VGMPVAAARTTSVLDCGAAVLFACAVWRWSRVLLPTHVRPYPGARPELTRTPRGLRWVRTGARTSLPRWVRAGGAGRLVPSAPRTVRVPAVGVPYVPRVVAPQART